MNITLAPAIEVVETPLPPADDWGIFIGDSRTGSSVATKLLAEHPDAMALCEYWLFGLLPIWMHPLVDAPCQEVANRELARAFRAYYHEDGHLTTGYLRACLEARRQAIAPGAAFFADKKGCYRACLGDVDALLPGAKLIMTRRNVWDVAASLMDVDWWRSRHAAKTRERQARLAYNEARKMARDDEAILASREDVFVLQFEDMADAPSATWGTLLDFLGLSTHDYPWRALEDTQYRQARGHWARIPELVDLRQAEGEL